MNFKKIKEWSKMPLEQRYNVIIALIVLTLCTVIIHYENKVNTENEQHRTTINSIVTRYRGDKAALEAKLETCNENYRTYLQESEKEFKALLFEAQRLNVQADELKQRLNENAR
jgi:Fe-S cluster biosynthesis and repair protein YggX